MESSIFTAHQKILIRKGVKVMKNGMKNVKNKIEDKMDDMMNK